MILQRREGCHGVSVPRRSMGLLLNGDQARNLSRQKTGTVATLASIPVHINVWQREISNPFAVSEKLQHWLSRSVSSTHSLPPPSTKHTLPPSQVNTEERQVERCRRLGRPTDQSKVSLWLDFIKTHLHRTWQNQTFTRSSLASPSVVSLTYEIKCC